MAWWMLAGMAVSAIGTALQVEGQKKSSEAQQNAAREQARIALFNSQINEYRYRRQTDALLASQMVGYAKSGVQVEGTPLAVMEQTAAQAEMEALLIKYGGIIEHNALIAGAGSLQAAQQVSTAATVAGGAASIINQGAQYK